MPEKIGHTINGWACDKTGCAAELTGPLFTNLFEGRDYYAARAEEDGWTLWVSRSRRTYCPDHKPGDRHKMRRLV